MTQCDRSKRFMEPSTHFEDGKFWRSRPQRYVYAPRNSKIHRPLSSQHPRRCDRTWTAERDETA